MYFLVSWKEKTQNVLKSGELLFFAIFTFIINIFKLMIDMIAFIFKPFLKNKQPKIQDDSITDRIKEFMLLFFMIIIFFTTIIIQLLITILFSIYCLIKNFIILFLDPFKRICFYNKEIKNKQLVKLKELESELEKNSKNKENYSFTERIILKRRVNIISEYTRDLEIFLSTK